MPNSTSTIPIIYNANLQGSSPRQVSRQLSGVEISRGPVTLFGKSARSCPQKLAFEFYRARRDVGRFWARAFYRGGGRGEARRKRDREREAANCARATLKDLTEKIGSDLSKRWRDGRVKLDRFHACTPRIDEPSPTCNQLSAAIRSSNGDRYGIGERLPIVCDRARPHINRWRERESDRYETRGSFFDPREKELDWKEDIDGWNWTDPEAEVFNRTKVEQSSVSWMVEGRWRAREEDRSKWGLSRERQSEAETAIRDK